MGLEVKKYFKLPPKFGLNISVVSSFLIDTLLEMVR